jgi:hypothetical protein
MGSYENHRLISGFGVTLGLLAASPFVIGLLVAGCGGELFSARVCSGAHWDTVATGVVGYTLISGLAADLVRWVGRVLERHETRKPRPYRQILRHNL